MAWFIVDFINVALMSDNVIQENYPMMEDFYLFQANSKVELHNKIHENINLINESGKDCTIVDEESSTQTPAKMKNLGVRRIYPFSSNTCDPYVESFPPKDGDLIISSHYELSSLKDIELFMKCEPIDVIYLESDEINLVET